jgi:hypothetical protein
MFIFYFKKVKLPGNGHGGKVILVSNIRYVVPFHARIKEIDKITSLKLFEMCLPTVNIIYNIL